MRFKSETIKIFTGFLVAISIFAAFVSVLASKNELFFVLNERISNIFSSDYFELVLAVVVAIATGLTLITSRRIKELRSNKRVFIIYAREDLAAAELIAQDLTERGFKPWLDVNEILPGQRWEAAVSIGLEESAIALFLISRHTEEKIGFFVKEYQAALKNLPSRSKLESPVIPILLEDSPVPDDLKGIQWVEYFKEGGPEYLYGSLGRILSLED